MNALRSKRLSRAAQTRALVDALRSASPTNDFAAMLSVTHRGLDVGSSSEFIRTWLATCDSSERFARFTSSPASFRPVYSKATARRESLLLPAGRAAMVDAMAVTVVGYLFSPVAKSRMVPRLVRESVSVTKPDGTKVRESRLVEKPALTPAQIASARHALALVGVDIIRSVREEKRDSVLVSQLDLAVRMGCAPATASKALATCVAAGWLSLRSERRGGAARYGIFGIATPKKGKPFSVRLPAALRGSSYNFVETIIAVTDLALGRDPVADLILLAGHPAWGHAPKPGPVAPKGSRRDGKVWLAALASEAGVDPTVLGVSRLAAKQGHLSWIAMNLESHIEAPLVELLDADARTTGADLAEAAARAKREASKTDRLADIAASRNAKANAPKVAEALLEKYPVPAPSAEQVTKQEWLEATCAAVNSIPHMDAHLRRALAKVLVSEMTAYGYPDHVAVKVAGRISAAADAAQPRAA